MTLKKWLLKGNGRQEMYEKKIKRTFYDPDSDIITLITSNLEKGENHIYKLCIPYKGEINEENGYIVWQKDLR
jgi:hypothetical protein